MTPPIRFGVKEIATMVATIVQWRKFFGYASIKNCGMAVNLPIFYTFVSKLV
jgi:hypothetical protein